jgi:hypothetical protein
MARSVVEAFAEWPQRRPELEPDVVQTLGE